MNEPVTGAELARVLELDAKATQGPIEVWEHEDSVGNTCWRLRALAFRQLAYVMSRREDADLIAEYRTLTPRLARELAAARAREKVVRAVLQSLPHHENCRQVVWQQPHRRCTCGKEDALAQLNTHTHE